MLAAVEEAGGKQCGNVVRGHRTVADTPVLGGDLDERFEPEHAARSGAYEIDGHVSAVGGLLDCGGHLVGTHGPGCRVAGT